MFHRSRIIADKPPPKSYSLLKFRGNEPSIYRYQPQILLPLHMVYCQLASDGTIPGVSPPVVYPMGRYFKERYNCYSTRELLFATEVLRFMMGLQDLPFLPFPVACCHGAPFENAFTVKISLAIGKVLKTPDLPVQSLLYGFLKQKSHNADNFIKQEKFLRRMFLDDGYSELAFLKYITFVGLSATISATKEFHEVPSLAVIGICNVVRDFRRSGELPLDAWDKLKDFAKNFVESE